MVLYIKFASFFIIFICPFFINALTYTKGFYLPFNNSQSIWGFDVGFGSDFEQNSSSTNPDVYCASRGDGYRLPTIEEMSHNLVPINSPKNTYTGRGIGTSVYGEWGYLSSYYSTNWSRVAPIPSEQLSWSPTAYWVQGAYPENANRRKAYLIEHNSEFTERSCTIIAGRDVCEYALPGINVEKFAKVACIKDI